MHMGIGKRSIRMPFSIGAILLLTLFWSVSCGSQGAVEWVNFVQFNGIQYLANYDASSGFGRALQQSDLGPVFATVQFKLAGNVNTPGYHVKDGDAGDLDAGTPVYTVTGYTPTFRLAAFRQGQIVLYEADDNPRAKTGADLLDIGGKVQSIGVNSWLDSKKQLAVIKDAKEVGDLVEMVLAAPVDHSFSSPGDAAYVIIFYLKDGTTVSRTYFTSTGELLHHILLPGAFKTAIEKAVHGSG
jgi:hypothetical protein